jgi:hypothetical protein
MCRCFTLPPDTYYRNTVTHIVNSFKIIFLKPISESVRSSVSFWSAPLSLASWCGVGVAAAQRHGVGAGRRCTKGREGRRGGPKAWPRKGRRPRGRGWWGLGYCLQGGRRPRMIRGMCTTGMQRAVRRSGMSRRDRVTWLGSPMASSVCRGVLICETNMSSQVKWFSL